jgi:hypothetical protein
MFRIYYQSFQYSQICQYAVSFHSIEDTYFESKMYATPKSIKEQKEKPQNVDVNENCKVAKFDPNV